MIGSAISHLSDHYNLQSQKGLKNSLSRSPIHSYYEALIIGEPSTNLASA